MSRPKHIVLIMTDQHRADHVGWSDQSRFKMPNLDRLAEGTVFDHCLTSNPICTPARTSLLTGKYSHQIGTLMMSGDLSKAHPTYAQALQRAGYQTAGIGKFHWLQTWKWGTPRQEGVNLVAINDDLKSFGFDYAWEAAGKQLAKANYCDYCKHLDDQGLLESFRDHVDARGRNFNEAENVEFTGEPWPLDEANYPDIVTTDKAIDWLDRQTLDKPLFLFASLVSPHAPFDPPQRYLDMVPYEAVDDFVLGEDEAPLDDQTKKRMWKLRRSYRAMLKLVDDQIGRIFDKLQQMGIWDDTVILFTTDHGEMLGDHGRFQKSIHWHQSAVVPTAIRHPDYLDARRVAGPVELTDLTATILDIAGLDPQQALRKEWPAFHWCVPCRSLMPTVRGEAERVRDYAFCECSGQWSMIHSDRYVFVRFHLNAPDPDHHVELLFDRKADPDETVNLAGDPAMSQILDWHRNRLLHVLETTPAAQTRWAPLMAPPIEER